LDSWQQLIVTGSDTALRSFIAGFEAAQGTQLGVAFGTDLGIDASSLAARVRALLAPGSSHHAIYCNAVTAAQLAGALAARGRDAGLVVSSQCEVHAASFSFEVGTFSVEVAQAIRQQFLEAAPEGVERLDYHADEIHRPDAQGAELYAPEHPFEFRARGTFRGPFPAIVELYHRARTFEHVTATPLRLETSAH